MLNPVYTASLTDQQRAWFYAEYQQGSKNELVAVLLALFLGGLGIHRFYMGQTGAAVLYLIFSWTGIPAIIGFIECFLMPGRVRAYNAALAERITARIATARPQGPSASESNADAAVAARVCSACHATAQAGAIFCARCGAGTLAAS